MQSFKFWKLLSPTSKPPPSLFVKTWSSLHGKTADISKESLNFLPQKTPTSVFPPETMGKVGLPHRRLFLPPILLRTVSSLLLSGFHPYLQPLTQFFSTNTGHVALVQVSSILTKCLSPQSHNPTTATGLSLVDFHCKRGVVPPPQQNCSHLSHQQPSRH